jgi:hypothetical protein
MTSKSSPVPELSKAIFYADSGDYKSALKIVSNFRRGLRKDQLTILKRGYECFNSPDFYSQLGFKPSECIESAISLFNHLYLKD